MTNKEICSSFIKSKGDFLYAWKWIEEKLRNNGIHVCTIRKVLWRCKKLLHELMNWGKKTKSEKSNSLLRITEMMFPKRIKYENDMLKFHTSCLVTLSCSHVGWRMEACERLRRNPWISWKDMRSHKMQWILVTMK